MKDKKLTPDDITFLQCYKETGVQWRAYKEMKGAECDNMTQSQLGSKASHFYRNIDQLLREEFLDNSFNKKEMILELTKIFKNKGGDVSVRERMTASQALSKLQGWDKPSNEQHVQNDLIKELGLESKEHALPQLS